MRPSVSRNSAPCSGVNSPGTASAAGTRSRWFPFGPSLTGLNFGAPSICHYHNKKRGAIVAPRGISYSPDHNKSGLAFLGQVLETP